MEKLIERILEKEWLEKFELTDVREIKKGNPEDFENETVIELRERNDQVPQNIPSGVELESKGFCDPIELIDHPLGGLATYLKFYRRRWRDKETKEEYHNHYDIRFPGTKLTRRFGLFLKAEDRDKVYQLLSALPYLRDSIEEDLVVVQKSSIRV